jgi:NAD(P)-dependent dehydrogenase (short-subunit alcohol dehydrogenase family)
MQELKERVAVVTGAALITSRTDVAQAAEVEALAKRTLEAFGAVHVVCNNAGVSGVPGLCWQRRLADWEWVLGVNLWGVIHGVRSFVPLMIEQGTEGHVVNTASVAGLISGPGIADYAVTKHAVVTLSESLHHELALSGSRVRVSVLCPGWVATRILESDRHRPESARAPRDPLLASPAAELLEKQIRERIASATPPEQVADRVIDAIRAERFWILTHPEFKTNIRTRTEDILEERQPTFQGLL